MTPVRIAFDASLPVVVSQGFTIGERAYKDGEPFAWQGVIDEPTLFSLWRSGMVSFLPAAQVANVAPAPAPQRTRRAAR